MFTPADSTVAYWLCVAQQPSSQLTACCSATARSLATHHNDVTPLRHLPSIASSPRSPAANDIVVVIKTIAVIHVLAISLTVRLMSCTVTSTSRCQRWDTTKTLQLHRLYTSPYITYNCPVTQSPKGLLNFSHYSTYSNLVVTLRFDKKLLYSC